MLWYERWIISPSFYFVNGNIIYNYIYILEKYGIIVSVKMNKYNILDMFMKKVFKMIIREANKQDANSICKICCDDLGYQCTNELILERLINLDKKREIVLVAENDHLIVGYIHAEIYNTLYYKSMVNILALAVLNTHRRCGIGKTLLEYIENWTKLLGIDEIRVNSGSSRKGAHNFYRSLGYNNEKEQIRFVKTID